MSLNHLVDGGAAPPQDVRVNNIYVEGNIVGGVGMEISPYNFRAASYAPTASVTSSGTGAGILGGVNLSYMKTGIVYQAHFKAQFQSGTGAKGVTCTIGLSEIPLDNPEELIVVATCNHQTGAGIWETLVVSNTTLDSTSIVIDLVRPTDDNFPANKDFHLDVSISFRDGLI